MKLDWEKLPYRLGVGIVLLNREGLVFVGQRIDRTTEAWQMPQGGIDEGEDPRAAAFRELEEEIGTAKADIISESSNWLTYDLPPELIGKVWRGKYRGQRQKWYAMRFTGRDQDIALDKHEPEFNEWKWVSLNELPDLIVPFKRNLYAQVVAEFRHLIA